MSADDIRSDLEQLRSLPFLERALLASIPLGVMDGRYRPYVHYSGMWYLAAYSKLDVPADGVERTAHGFERNGNKHILFYSDEADAQRHCDRLNVRLQ